MELVNEILPPRGGGRERARAARSCARPSRRSCSCSTPSRPHVCEEMWARLGHERGPGPRRLARLRRRGRPRGRGRAGGPGERQGPRARGRGPRAPRGRDPRRRRWPSPGWPSTWRASRWSKVRGRSRPPGQRGGQVRRRAGPRGRGRRPSPRGCGYALAGPGHHDRPLGQADRRAALQGPHRQARPRRAGDPGGDRGAAQARALHGGQGGHRTSTRWSRARSWPSTWCPSTSPTRAGPDPGHALRDHPHRQRRLPQDRPDGAALVERRLLAARRVRHGRERRRPTSTARSSRSSGSPTAFARSLVAAMLEAF